jgi:ABC-2 type transport system ATP-binding protein
LLHDPKVLILDEPASDLDPRARIELRDLLLELRDLGKTIFLSSHILTELSDVCTSVGILERGQLVVAGPIAAIGEELARRNRNAAVSPVPEGAPAAAGPDLGLTAGGAAIPPQARRRLKLRVLGDARLVAPLLAGGVGVHQVEPAPGGVLTVDYTGDERFVADVVRHLVGQGVAVVGVEPERNELERIFLEVTRGDLQ